ncbi:MAG TPA: AAA family ATPase [Methanothrix sp.]|jgi:MoxR-like ATPase|nr:AAA family ATPase [Methanothrix sp.]HQJ79694.1 AAA family ATPase [Methanothrix sp.]
MPDPKSKIEQLVSSLEELRLHLGRKDLLIGGDRINSQLYFCLANACLRSRAILLYGGMGANKTTLINLLGASFLGLELDRMEDLMVTGHPEQTEEKIVGFLDPRQWTGQKEGPVQVLWTDWAGSRWKLINEINRFPSGKQNLFLEILQKRRISYAGQVCQPGETCYFATMNPEFSATYPLDQALLDRISACVPAYQPDFLAGLLLSEREREVRDLAGMLPRFTESEFSSLPQLVAGKPLSSQVELAVLCLIRDFTLCERAPSYDKTQLSGSKPSLGLCSGCHYHNNPEAICWQTDEGLSDRVRQDLRIFCRAFAFLLDRQADLEILRAIAPYVIWHRINPMTSVLEKPPYFGVGKLAYVASLVNKSIDRTMNERREMNLIYSHAMDREISASQAIEELSSFDDPIARMDFIPHLESRQ